MLLYYTVRCDVTVAVRGRVEYASSLYVFTCFPILSVLASIHPGLFPRMLSQVWHHGNIAVCGASHVECVWRSRCLGPLQSLLSNGYSSRGISPATSDPQLVWGTSDRPHHCYSTSLAAPSVCTHSEDITFSPPFLLTSWFWTLLQK